MAIGLKIKHSTGEITTGTGNLTLNAAGDLVLDYATFPASDGTAGYILSTDGAGALSWIADSSGPANTDALPEGSSNLYYTDARTDARIVNAGSANWNTAYGWGDHASGGYLTSVGALTSHTDVTISGPSTGQHLTWSGSAWTNSSVSAASAAGADTQVQFNDGGNMGADAGLTYAKATDTLTAGTFTTSGASPTLTAAAALAITTTASNGSITITPHGSGDIILDGQKWPQADGTAGYVLTTNGLGQLSWVADDDTPAGYNNANWDTAYGWGDHSSGGYLTSETSHADVLQDGDFTSQGIMLRGAGAGTYSILADASTNWNTAYTHAVSAHAPSGAEANEYSFKTILVSGQSDVVADTTTDALTLVAGGNMTLTTSGDTITFAAAGGGVSDFVSLTDTPANYSGAAAKFVKVNSSGNALIFVADPGYITRTDVSVTTGSASGAGTLAYNNGTGVFTYQPADLSSYLTSIDLNSLSSAAIDTANDSIAFIDATDNSTKKESIADVLLQIAGTNLTAVGGVLNASGGGGGGDTFKTIAVSGQTDVVADSSTDTLTLAAGSGMTITTTAGTDTITFAASGGGGSSSETFTVNYAAGGTSISSISNLPSGWSSSINGNNVTITHTAGGQPMGVSFYGLDKSASPDVWKYAYPTSTYPLTFPDSSETISTTEFTLNIGTAATGANTGTPFATSKAHIKVIF